MSNSTITPVLEVTDNQLDAISELGLKPSDVQEAAQKSFDSMLRGKVKGAINTKVIAKHTAVSLGKNAAAERLGQEIVNLEAVFDKLV